MTTTTADPPEQLAAATAAMRIGEAMTGLRALAVGTGPDSPMQRLADVLAGAAQTLRVLAAGTDAPPAVRAFDVESLRDPRVVDGLAILVVCAGLLEGTAIVAPHSPTHLVVQLDSVAQRCRRLVDGVAARLASAPTGWCLRERWATWFNANQSALPAVG
jgi:hypothetical protein